MAKAKPDEPGYYQQDDLLKVDHSPKPEDWLSKPADFRPGSFIYAGKEKNLKILDLPNPREWSVSEADWTGILRTQPPGDLRRDANLLKYAKDSAYRLVADEPFRRRFPSVANWFAALKANNPSVGHQGIVCGGRWTRDADISGNRVHGYMIGIQVTIEYIFAVPGMGSAILNAVVNRDFPVIQGFTLIIAIFFLLANIAADVLYALLDPRIRY